MSHDIGRLIIHVCHIFGPIFSIKLLNLHNTVLNRRKVQKRENSVPIRIYGKLLRYQDLYINNNISYIAIKNYSNQK